MTPERRRDLTGLLATLGTLAADQGSKLAARTALEDGPVTVIPGFFDLVLARNPDVAFSMFGFLPGKRWIFSALAFGAAILIGVVMRRSPPERRLRTWSLGLLAGGALGNMLDRLLTGSVWDFILWHVHQYRWPVFNIADAALLVGICLLFIEESRANRKKKPATE